ncbi:unnamed protein product [Rhizophagus irregularis]|nr:unnamed protein product [Rhizophagus irregularis]
MSAIENISPSVIKRISKEINALVAQPPEGIKVIVNESDVCDVQAWIYGPESTPYEGGYFKVKLVLGADFPAAPPKCYFITKLFHPNVSKSGEVCVNTLKKDWNKDSGLNFDNIFTTTIITSTTSPSTSSPKKFVSSQMMTKTTSQQITASTTETNTMTTNNSNTTNSINNSSTMNIPALITPLTVSNSMNESKSPNAMNNGGANSNHNHLKKSPTSVNSNDNQLASNNPTVTPKKRAGDKKLDKKQADKKRSLKRL